MQSDCRTRVRPLVGLIAFLGIRREPVIISNRGKLVFRQKEYITAVIGRPKTVDLSLNCRVTAESLVKACSNARKIAKYGRVGVRAHRHELLEQVLFIRGAVRLDFWGKTGLNRPPFAKQSSQSAGLHVGAVFHAWPGREPYTSGMKSSAGAPGAI